jgi:transcriptional regulator with XRE-family HTH domain
MCKTQEGQKMPVDEKIREYKQRESLSIRDVSNELGVGKSAVTSWMNGANRPSIDHLVSLARLFKLTDAERLEFYESAVK